MSRSYKTRPIYGICGCKSEKEDKRIWHKRFRSRTRDAINSMVMNEDWDMPIFDVRQLSNPWDMSKDGKGCFRELLRYKRHKLFWKQLIGAKKVKKCPWRKRTYDLSELKDRHRWFGK